MLRFHSIRFLIGLVLILVLTQFAVAQSFEVASVKAGHIPESFQGPLKGAVFSKENARVDFRFTSPEVLIMAAYPNFKIDQIVFPAWLAGSDVYYDVAATPPAGTTNDQLTVMLRNLLADRFKLQTHMQDRVVDVYVLKQSAQGSTLRSVEPENPAPRVMAIPLADVWRITSPGRAAGTTTTMSALLRTVSSRLSRLVLDQTGLTGTYAIDLSFRRDTDPSAADLGWRDDEFFAALQKCCGLTVAKQRSTVTTLMVDYMEQMPTPN